MNPMLLVVLGLWLSVSPALAQTQPAPATPPATDSATKNAFSALLGRWIRVQGGYVITINSVDTDGRLDAFYVNPRPLPFYTAVATNHGNGIKVFFELRAAGYNGSTYTLGYDAANDRLTGVYDQVVVKQRFEVTFVRGNENSDAKHKIVRQQPIGYDFSGRVPSLERGPRMERAG